MMMIGGPLQKLWLPLLMHALGQMSILESYRFYMGGKLSVSSALSILRQTHECFGFICQIYFMCTYVLWKSWNNLHLTRGTEISDKSYWVGLFVAVQIGIGRKEVLEAVSENTHHCRVSAVSWP